MWPSGLTRSKPSMGRIRSLASRRRATNEDGYVFQKLMRCAIGTNNIDHCARLCHMASVVGLKQAIGSGAPSASAVDIGIADVLFAGRTPSWRIP